MSKLKMPHGDLLVAPQSMGWVNSIFEQIASSEAAQDFNQKVSAAASDEDFWGEDYARFRPYNVENGVLTVSVQGVLVNKFPYAFGGLLTGYEYVESAVARGVADPEVREIVLDIDSPGGLVAGCFECADAIYGARGTKPIKAIANDSAYSAAYALASSADSITVTRTGGVGSIGVIVAHVSMSAALEKAGYKVTLIHAGAEKADGHPAIPLSDRAKTKMQERVNALYDIFVSTVARNRGLDEQAVRNTEAATFMAREAIEIGLADTLGDLDSLSAYADPSNKEDYPMSKNDTSAVEQAATEEALATATAAATQAAVAEAAAEAANAERARIAAILDSEEAASRPNLARRIALKTDLAPEAALELLGGAAEETKEEKAAGTSSFEALMDAAKHPELGADAGADVDPDEAFLAEFYSFRK